MGSLSDTVDRVAQYTTTLDVEDHDWQRAIAVNGLLAVDREWEWVRRVVDRAIETQTSEGQFAYGWGNYPKEWARWTEYDVETYNPTINSAAVAYGALDLYERTDDATYRDAVRRQYEFYDGIDRTADGGISRRLEQVELWTETLYFYCPFVARLGRLEGDDALVEDAVEQALIHLTHLQDDGTDLWRHVWRETPNRYPESSFWARANGWAAAGLLETLRWVPDDHPERGELESALHALFEALLPLQDDSGFWHQVLDDPTTPQEASGTLIFAHTLKASVDGSVFDDDSFVRAARRAMDAVVGVTDPDGAVHRVSKPPASARSPLGVTPYGQGWFLLAASRFL